jgi:FkbM family methyltransferase
MLTRYKDRLRPVYHVALNTLNPGGKTVNINGTDRIKLGAYLRNASGHHEPDVWKRLMDEVRPGDTCVDLGASIGLYTLGFALRLRGKGMVFSFEPDPLSQQRLVDHIALNGVGHLVCPINVAVSDNNGVIRFASGTGPTSHAAWSGDTNSISVATLRLDSFFDGAGPTPDIMKIDVEGLELQVLKGAVELLRNRKRPRLIYVDVHPWAWSKLGLDTTEHALHELLVSSGYIIEKRNDVFSDFFARSA